MIRVAIIHEWLVTYAGSEKILSEMVALFPQADLFCLLDASGQKYANRFQGKAFKSTFLQAFVGLERSGVFQGIHRYLLPLMPIAIEQLELAGYDLVISNSHAVAKGVIVGPDQLHISYCYTPMRYAWDLQNQYLHEQRITGLRGLLARLLLHRIRMWDSRTASGVDHFIACSSYIERRIRRVYRRSSSVIYPGVDTEYYKIGDKLRGDFYVTSSRQVPYKKVGLIAEAFASMPDRKLVVIGDGPLFKSIKKLESANISVLGYQPDHILREYLQTAKAYVFAAEEDFGISPLEAQACGTPVIAFGRGGACETVADGLTGLLYNEQSARAIKTSVERFEAMEGRFEPAVIRRHAEAFSMDRFRREFKATIESLLAAHRVGTANLTIKAAAE